MIDSFRRLFCVFLNGSRKRSCSFAGRCACRQASMVCLLVRPAHPRVLPTHGHVLVVPAI